MFLGLFGVLVGLVIAVLALTVLYYVIRFAVRDGMVDAQRRIEVERVRAQLHLGRERSPNSPS